MNILLNGAGRIGKSILRIAEGCDDINIVAINELNSNIKNIAYNINYDSTYGRFENFFHVEDNYIKNSNSKIKVFNHKNLSQIDFKSENIDIVVDASGAKVDIKELNKLPLKHIILTHPNKNANINLIMGVNEDIFDKKKDKVVSTSSCNATALLPLLKIIDENFNILNGDVTTIHPLLNHQKTLDSGCVGSSDREISCNFEFGRSATQNIIPSQTTTIDACSYVFPKIDKDIISSSSFRVPTSTVGAINVVLNVEKKLDKDRLIKILKEYEANQKYKILLNNFCPLVSSDFAKQEYTTIVDHRFTHVQNSNMIKLVLWYDNEWGYASKVVEILKKL